jgi:hypothetical protein
LEYQPGKKERGRMSRIYLSHRIRYGEIDKVNIIISFLEKVKAALKSDEDSEFILVCDVEEGRIRFHLARLSEEEIINPLGPYQVDTKETLYFNCAKDILDDASNWTHFSPNPDKLS